MKRSAMFWLAVGCLLCCLTGCGDDKKGGGEACTSDDDCSSGSCITDADGNKTCGEDSGGW
jgi:hypothetical protein